MFIFWSRFYPKSLVMGLTYWGRVTHICVGKLTIIGSDNGLSPGLRQAIIWASNGTLSIGDLGTNVSEILIGIQTFSCKKMQLKMSSVKWHPFCNGLVPNRPKAITYESTQHDVTGPRWITEIFVKIWEFISTWNFWFRGACYTVYGNQFPKIYQPSEFVNRFTCSINILHWIALNI